jgi:methionyl-tRNA synthetase
MNRSFPQEKSQIFITTPLYYVNARPHLGHAYTTLIADSLARFSRQEGLKTLFLTGTDEHGEKIEKAANGSGKTPQQHADEYSGYFSETWKRMGISADIFYRTTAPSHYSLVKNVLSQLKERGEIYFATYQGKYCVGCERYRTDQEWGADGLCPDHKIPPEIREESNYFFKMSAYQQRLLDYYQKHPEAIQPSHYMNEALAMLRTPLEDLCISRPLSRLKWGIPLPFDPKYVTYVWFDALLNYIGGLGYDGTEKSKFDREAWATSTQFIGKDILKTHAVYWPIMLMSLGIEPFHRLLVHGFWLSSGMKMSKSLGNVVDPMEIENKYGSEVFRYYLMREMSFGLDSQFSQEGFVSRINADLANGIGNLASRVLALAHKYLEARVPEKSGRGEAEKLLQAKVAEFSTTFRREFHAARFHLALNAFAEAVGTCDRYVNDKAPWSLGKDPAKKGELIACLGALMDTLRDLSLMMVSILPNGSQRLRVALGIDDSKLAGHAPGWNEIGQGLIPGTPLGEKPMLYSRIEVEKEKT